MPGKGRPFISDDPRRNIEGRPKKKTFQDILDNLGAIVVKDGEGNEIERIVGEDRLIKEIVDVGIREKNPAMMKFIYQHMNMPQIDPEIAQIKKQSERARALKLEIANERARGELISRSTVIRVMGKIYAAHQANFLSIGPTSSGLIAAELGVKGDAERLKIEELITKDTYQALSAIKREINDFLIYLKTEPIKIEEQLSPVKKPEQKRKIKG